MGRARRSGGQGLTMVELLITASIVAVSLLAIATIFPVAMGNIDVGGEETTATAVGQGFIEMARNVDWDTLTKFNGLDTSKAGTCPPPAAVTAACQAWIDQVRGNQAKKIPGLVNGRATVQVTTGPGLNPLNTQQLATITVTLSWARRGVWLPIAPLRNLVLTTVRSQ